MTAFNPDEIFPTILTKIENGQVKTTHQLRLILDDLSEEFSVRPLSLLIVFREWLLKRNIILDTQDGMVGLSKDSE